MMRENEDSIPNYSLLGSSIVPNLYQPRIGSDELVLRWSFMPFCLHMGVPASVLAADESIVKPFEADTLEEMEPKASKALAHACRICFKVEPEKFAKYVKSKLDDNLREFLTKHEIPIPE
ncbi:MAG: hypothetical protein HC888_00745 [Candidatus Competibacteraceae bacterium]|nr:hypothetical protein [Candidatus Competibacteraceae bacterium]